MFPPKKTSDPYEWVRGLWTSLRSASPHVGERVDLQTQDDKTADVAFRLVERPTQKVEQAMKEYIRVYARSCGWKAREVKIKNGYVAFRASIDEAPAASRA